MSNIDETTKLEPARKDRKAECEDWFVISKKYMEPRRLRMKKNGELYYGDMPLSTPKMAMQMKFALPLAVVETEMPIIADYLPTFDVKPTNENDIPFADAVQKRKVQLETKSDFKFHTLSATKDSLIYGDGLLRIMPIYKETKGTDGKVTSTRLVGLDIKPIDVFTWFPAPDATGTELGVDCRYHIFAAPVHVDMVKKQYGKTVSAEGSLDEFKAFTPTAQGDDASTDDCVLLKECYSMDEDEAKYPYGRYTVWVSSEVEPLVDSPLWDGAEMSEDDDYRPGMPVFHISNYGSHSTMFGIGETYLVRTQTLAINETMSAMGEAIKKTGNPVRKVMQSWVNSVKQAIKGYAGEQIVVTNPNDVTWDNTPQIPVSTFQFIELTRALTDVVTGVHDVMAGKNPAGVTAASAIMALQEAAQARVRFKIAWEINGYIKEVGRFMAWIMKNYDKEKTSIRDTDEVGGVTFIDFDPEQQTGDTRFDIEIVAGVAIPAGRVASEEIARTKFNEGIYGIEEYVMNSNETDKQGVIDSWYERQGLAQAKERMEALQEAQLQLGEIIEAGVEEGSQEEDDLALMIQQFPELLQTDEFNQFPPGLKERLLMVFVAGQTTEAQVA